MTPTPFVYRAKVVSIYDGDTLTVDIDLGLGNWVHARSIRLHGIDTPELRGEERDAGIVARDYLRSFITPGTKIILQTIKDHTEKYGRYLGVIYLEDGTNLNELLLKNGYAKAL